MPLSFSFSLSHQHLLHTHFNKKSVKKCGLLQQPIYTLPGRAYRQSPLQLLYITSSESQSRRIARRVDGCDGVVDGRAEEVCSCLTGTI